jgi:drug/metabolite transporter (DMT)-like permease
MLVTTLITALCLVLSNDGHLLRAFISAPEYRPWLLLRGLFGTASFWLLYRSLKFLPVEDQQAIWYSCPILSKLP